MFVPVSLTASLKIDRYLARANIVLRDFNMYFDASDGRLLSTRVPGKVSMTQELIDRFRVPTQSPQDGALRNYTVDVPSPSLGARSRAAPGASLSRLQQQWDERMRETSHPGGPIGSPFSVGLSSS